MQIVTIGLNANGENELWAWHLSREKMKWKQNGTASGVFAKSQHNSGLNSSLCLYGFQGVVTLKTPLFQEPPEINANKKQRRKLVRKATPNIRKCNCAKNKIEFRSVAIPKCIAIVHSHSPTNFHVCNILWFLPIIILLVCFIRHIPSFLACNALQFVFRRKVYATNLVYLKHDVFLCVDGNASSP